MSEEMKVLITSQPYSWYQLGSFSESIIPALLLSMCIPPDDITPIPLSFNHPWEERPVHS